MTIARYARIGFARGRASQLAVATLFTALPLGAATAAPSITKVTGLDTATAPAQQAETGYNLSVVGSQRIETVTSDDETGEEPQFVQYTASSRTVFPGYSLLGWSFRIRTAQNPNPPFTHAAKIRPPAGFAALWGNPSITSNPDLPNVVLLASLAVPTVKFGGASIVGSVGGDANGCSPLGAACVARSTDGGQTFSIASCFSDTRPINNDPCAANLQRTNGHFLDGSSVAITRSGSTFTGYAAFIDTDRSSESIWRMADVSSSPAQAFVRDDGRLGTIGDTGQDPDQGDLGGIGTHVRLRAHGADLWKMSRDGGDLKVNIHGRNATFVLAATNVAEDTDNSGRNPTVILPNDAQGRPVTVRTGPQFAFDIGFNESGQEEMRFVYLARDNRGVFLQGGFCPINLASSCKTPPEWQMPAFATPAEFHPAIKFGLIDAATHRGTWKVTVQGVVSGPVAIFDAELVRLDLVPGSPTANPTTGLASKQEMTEQPACPDLRVDSSTGRSFGYWGDYDDMGFDPVSKTFTRVFTDSGQGCSLRQQLTSRQVHVSAIELPSAASNRLFNVVGTLVQLKDIDNCPPCDSTLDNQPISFALKVNPTTTSATQPVEFCLDHDVKLRVVFSASLDTTDLEKLHVCVTQGLREESGFLAPSVCDESVDQGPAFCADLGPGEAVGVDDGGLNIPDFATAIWNATLTNAQDPGP